MTYYDITVKMKNLTMEPSDWTWLDEYLKSKPETKPDAYRELVNAYQAREAGEPVRCDTFFGTCRYCHRDFVCTYKGFCARQKEFCNMKD